MLPEIKDMKDFNDKIDREQITIIFFCSPQCVPCKALEPILEQFSKENNLKVYKVNVVVNLDIAKEYYILNIPTVLLFENNYIVAQINNISIKNANGLLIEYLKMVRR